jgi:hypothetical protein
MKVMVKCGHGVERTVEYEEGREGIGHPNYVAEMVRAVALGCPVCKYESTAPVVMRG